MASETFGGDSYQTPAAAIYARYNKSALYPAIEKTLQPCPEACDAQYMCGKLCLHPSLYLDQHNGGGVETTGAIEWVHAMLLQSRDGVLRLFPHLPETTRAARFVRLRTYVPQHRWVVLCRIGALRVGGTCLYRVGAFLVTANYSAGAVESPVLVQSEAAQHCTMEVRTHSLDSSRASRRRAPTSLQS